MNPELERKLYLKYPKIFVRKDLPMGQTCMCWGIDCEDGWYHIIDALCAQIQHHIDWKNCEGKHEGSRKYRPPEADGTWVQVQQLQAEQVKEKYGGLRFYAIGGDDYTEGLIDMASALSLRVCETCGAPARQTKSGWIRTLCPTHAAERQVDLADEAEDEDGNEP